MATVKIILRKEQKADGTYPLALRITQDRKTSYIYLNHSIKEDDWDSINHLVKKSHPSCKRLNNFLLKKLSEASNTSLQFETDKEFVTAQSVRQKIKPSAGNTFFSQADLYIERLKEAGKYNQYTAEKPRVKRFRQFVGHEIAFQDITPVLLERFKNHIMTEYGSGERTAVNHLVVIRSVFSQAIKENVTDVRFYPFGKGKVKIKFPESAKIGLTLDEVKRLEDVELIDREYHHARNLWLLSFYFAGMRISDELRLRWSQVKDQRLHYTMGKNNKVVSLKISDKATKILDQYKQFQQNAEDLIFSELKGCDFADKFKTQRTIAFKISALDKCLRLHVAPKAGIDKKLTMHIARHSFAQNAKHIDVRTLQYLFRHSKLETTEGYMGNFIHKDADEALDKILAFEPSGPYNPTPLKTSPQKSLLRTA